jgi:DNA-binding Lrp family transcriptional regulator
MIYRLVHPSPGSLFIGVVKGVFENMTEDSIKNLISKCYKMSKYGSSLTFKVHYDSREEIDEFLRRPVEIGYERLVTQDFFFIMKRCYSCHKSCHKGACCCNAPTCFEI